MKDPNALIISPNGDAELLKSAKEIIGQAPKLNEWEFYYSKPPKSWDLFFEMQSRNDEIIKIDANTWKYVLLKYPDNKFEIIIKAPDLKAFDDDAKILAAEILLDGVIGEERRIELIVGIEVVEEFELDHMAKSNDIKKSLSNHLDKLL